MGKLFSQKRSLSRDTQSKQKRSLSRYTQSNVQHGTLLETKERLNVVDPGLELQRLDSLTCYVSMVTAWSGLFFILFPYCSDNEFGCAVLLVAVMIINVAFLAYCILLFRVEIVGETKRTCSLIMKYCRRAPDTLPEDANVVELSAVRNNTVHGNPLLYRKSFVEYQNTVNPIHIAAEKEKNRESILQIRALKSKANSRRSERIQRLAQLRQERLEQNYASSYEWTAVTTKEGSFDYFYNPRTCERRQDDPRKDWVPAKDEDGDIYYYHVVTNEVRWETAADRLQDWVSAIDQSGKQYFHHKGTGETRWDDPLDPWELLFDEETDRFFYRHNHTGETHWVEKEKKPSSVEGDKLSTEAGPAAAEEIIFHGNPLHGDGKKNKKNNYSSHNVTASI